MRKIRGPVDVTRLPLVRTAKVRGLSGSGVELVVRNCSFVCEGGAVEEDGALHYYGSAMITLETADLLREGCAVAPEDLLRLVRSDPLLNLRLMRLARLEAARRLGAPALGTAVCTVEAACKAGRLEVTIDVELRNIERAPKASTG